MNSQDYFSRERGLKELLDLGDDDSGYIQGKIFMIWPPRNKLHRINLEVAEDAALYRFELEVPHRDGITFRPHERVCFALKGICVDRRKESSAPHYFPVTLRFPNGVILKYLNGINAGKIVDTWSTRDTDEWYNPGIIHSVSDAVTIDASEIQHGAAPAIARTPIQTLSSSGATGGRSGDIKVDRPPPWVAVAVVDGTSAARSMQQPQHPDPEKRGRSSKSRARKKRKLHNEKESTSLNRITNATDELFSADIAIPCQPQTPTDVPLACASNSRPSLHHVDGHTNGQVVIQEDHAVDLSRENNHTSITTDPGEAGLPVVQLKAGVRTERGDVFTALNDLRKGHSMINVIGIVTSANPEKRTTTNAWGRSFTLVDPSAADLPQQAITVNCFQEKYPEWLPQVQKGDVVILRKLKIADFHGALTATGYGDKLRWAVYDPVEHSIRPPNKGTAPTKESVDNGMGYEFSPYWEPFQDSIELKYCRQIGEWWKAKCEPAPNVSTVEFADRPRKRHLLISEASPDLPPHGFFNCTVEVLQKFSSHGSGMVTVYVTDYTTNASLHTMEATWCPPELSDRVLQCSMWDDARNIAMTMNPGEYWYLYNVRAKWNPSHSMEATMQLAEKVTQLDESKLEAQPHLKALLARKKEFELNKSDLTSGSASLHIFPEMAIQDVDGSTSFLTCIVELLHIDLSSQDGHLIYVTDYTYNPDLPAALSTADWARDLEHRVIMIKLDDSQAKISVDLRPGSICIIHNLRIKRSKVSGGMHGYLGGEDTLIVSLYDPSSHHVETLKRNKEKWNRENMLNILTTPSNRSHGEAKGALEPPPTVLASVTLQEVLETPAPKTFRVSARAMDFFPFSLEDACVLRCTKCESSPPPSFKQCPRCDDMMETHTKWFYCLYVLLQDEQGSEIIVSLSGKECMLLQDIGPTDFRRDPETFNNFLAKLDPILGNLRDVHVAWSRNEYKVIQSPLMTFTLESWDVGDERGYGLLDCAST